MITHSAGSFLRDELSARGWSQAAFAGRHDERHDETNGCRR